MKDLKKCKGINKAHGFSGCGKEVDVRTRKYGLCPVCRWEWMETTEAGRIHYRKHFAPKVKKAVIRDRKKQDRETRESLKSIARLIQEARVPFQKWIRLRDANRACISCNQIGADIFDAGHFYKSELYSGLIFDETNCHSQCRACNRYLNGNEANYRLGLIKRFGDSYVKELDAKALIKRNYKYTREEILDIKTSYLDKIKLWHKK